MKRNMLNFTRQFALLSFFCILSIGLVSAFLVSKIISEKILLRDANLNMEFVESVIASEGTWHMFLDTTDGMNQRASNESHWALNSFFSHVSHMPDVFRVNVFGRDHSVLWSSGKEVLEDPHQHTEELNKALKGQLIYNFGVVGADLTERHTSYILAKTKQGRQFIETYLPVWNKQHNQVVGVVELYRIPDMLHHAIMDAKKLIWLGTFFGGMLLYLCLYWIIKRANRILENQQRGLVATRSFVVIGQTATAMTNALRNPLTVIRTSAEQSLTEDLEGARNSARNIMDATDRLDRWARDLLQFSVTNKDTPEYLDINDLITTVLNDHQSTLKRKTISQQLNLSETHLLVEANFMPLSQVFGNLIMNAIEFMGRDGQLTISTFPDRKRKRVCVTVSDNGPGLPEEIKDRLFQPFTTTKSTGTGLGLALSKHLVEHYRGDLHVSSKTGQGVTVTVCLPAAESSS